MSMTASLSTQNLSLKISKADSAEMYPAHYQSQKQHEELPDVGPRQYYASQKSFVNDGLKNIVQIEHPRHRSLSNFITNALSAIAAYCLLPKKPSVSLEFMSDNQFTLF